LVDWKNISILVPIVTALFGSSFIIPFLIDKLPDILTNPILKIDRNIFQYSYDYSYLTPNNTAKLPYTISNVGTQTADDVHIRVFFPYLNNTKIFSNSISLESKDDHRLYDEDLNDVPLNVTGKSIDLDPIAAGSKVDLTVVGNVTSKYDVLPIDFPCVINIIYNNESISYNCTSATQQSQMPYIYTDTEIFIILCISLICVILVSFNVYFSKRLKEF
jgi:hypothetical protein